MVTRRVHFIIVIEIVLRPTALQKKKIIASSVKKNGPTKPRFSMNIYRGTDVRFFFLLFTVS